MPDDEDLDEMAQKVCRCNFEDIAAPEHRAIIMDLAIKADQCGDVADMALWFRKSKLWEGS
jgi:hypothetical protein